MSSHTSLEQDGSDLTKKKLRHLEHTLLSEGEASLPFEEEEVSLPLEEEDKPLPTQPGHPQLSGFPPRGAQRYFSPVWVYLLFIFFGGGGIFFHLAKASQALCMIGAQTARGHDRAAPRRGARSAERTQSLP